MDDKLLTPDCATAEGEELRGCQNGLPLAISKRKWPFSHKIEMFLYYAAAPTVSLLFFTVSLIYLNIWPYGDRIISSYDMLAQVAPFAEHFFDVLENRSSLFYSFSIAGGADVFGTLAYCMVSPFSFIFLLGGKGMTNYMVPFVLGAKIACISLSASYFIKKLFNKINPICATALAVTYTYSGYFHVANTFIVWLDFLIYLPLAVVAFKRFMSTGKYLAFSLAISACIYACFSIACFSLLIIFLILFAYVWLCVERQKRWEALTKICMSLVIAVALAMPILLPSFMAYLGSGRNTGLFENLSNSLNADHLYSKLSYVLSDGLFFILGAAYLIICKKAKGRTAFLWITTALVFAPVLIDEVCLLLNAGSYMSYSLRFGFLNSVLGLYLSCCITERFCSEEQGAVKRYKWPLSSIIGVICILICSLTMFGMQDILDNGEESFLFKWSIFAKGALNDMFVEAGFAQSFSGKFAHSLGGLEIIGFIFAAVGISTILIILLTKLKVFPKQVAAVTLITLSFIQVGFYSFHTVNGNRTSYTTYDQIQPLLDSVESAEGNLTDFRVKDYDEALTANAPLTMHYRAYSVFSSVIDSKNFFIKDYFMYSGNGINTIKTQTKYSEQSNRIYGDVFADCLLGYKYAFTKEYNNSVDNKIDIEELEIWEHVEANLPYHLYENKYAFPTAFTIPGGEYSLTEGDYGDQLDSFYRFLGGEGELTVKTGPADVKAVKVNPGGYYRVTITANEKCKGNTFLAFNFPEELTIKHNYSTVYEEESASVVTNTSKKYMRFTNDKKPAYSFSLYCEDEGFGAALISECVRLVTISIDKVKELALTAQANAVDFEFKKNGIKTTVENGENKYLFVNYLAVDGYKAKLNGEKAKLIDNDFDFLVVELDGGENTVDFTYASPYIKFIFIGLLIGAVFSAAMIFAFEYYSKIKKAFEITACSMAHLLAGFILSFGFIYPVILFIIKLFKLIL